jgi:xylulokinase
MKTSLKPDYALGIDLGTSGVKAGLLDLASYKLAHVARRAYPGLPEQEPELLWEQTVAAIQDVLGQAGDSRGVQAIGLTGQMHGAVLFDRHGGIIGPLLSWKENRWSNPAVIEQIRLTLADWPRAELGMELAGGITGAILFGIRESDPQLFRRIAHVVLPVDFLRSKLLGKGDYATDPTDAGGTGLFDPRLDRWHDGLIRELRLPPAILPEVHASAEIAGFLSAGVAHCLGLPEGIPVVFGGGDNQAGMAGSGLAGPSSPLLVNIGTAAQASKVMEKFQRFPGLETRAFFDGLFAAVRISLGGGGSYAWLQAEHESRTGERVDFAAMDRSADQVPPGSDGLIFCPGPTRESPERRRGFLGNAAWVGDLGHQARAVLEGVLMDLYEGVEVLDREDAGGMLLAGGRGLQASPVWAQMAADLFGKRLRLTGSENAVRGAALLAVKGLGSFDGLEPSILATKSGREFVPQTDRTKYYREEFADAWRQAVQAG